MALETVDHGDNIDVCFIKVNILGVDDCVEKVSALYTSTFILEDV